MSELRSTSAAQARVNDPVVIESLLRTPARWAVVGLSSNTARAAYGVALVLQELGMQIVPIHPAAHNVHGEIGYSTLVAVPESIDVVDVFVRSDVAGDVIDEAIAIGAKAVWLQLGVIDDAAATRALDAGLAVVMDRCPAIERLALSLDAQQP